MVNFLNYIWNFIYGFSAIYVYGLYLSSVHFYDTRVFSGIHIINTPLICQYSNQNTLARSFCLFWCWGKGFQSSISLLSVFLAFLKISLTFLYYFYLTAAAKSSVVSDSVWPHRRQPTRLPCPWDSPGKNSGVGCHFLLQRMKVKSESEVTQSCLTLSNPMDCSLPGSSIHGRFHLLDCKGTLSSPFLTTTPQPPPPPTRSCAFWRLPI